MIEKSGLWRIEGVGDSWIIPRYQALVWGMRIIHFSRHIQEGRPFGSSIVHPMDNERRKLKQAGLFLAQPEDIQPVHRRTTRADIVENDIKEPVDKRQPVVLMSMINPRSNGTRRSDNLIDMNDGLNRSVACRQQLVERASRVGAE